MKSTLLSLSWSISRGADTYGYNICRLDDGNTGKRYRCSGGGYDMVGTVFGDWLQEAYQERLCAIARHSAGAWDGKRNTSSEKPSWYEHSGRPLEGHRLYGMTHYPHQSRVVLDGACGIESMVQICKAIGLDVKTEYNRTSRRGGCIGFFVSEKEEVAA